MKKILLFSVVAVTLLGSCIKKEGAYREADIMEFTLPDDVMSNVAIGKNLITVQVHDMALVEDKILAPSLVLSAGATVEPASDQEVKVTDNLLTYIVTSEDGNKKGYLVNFQPHMPMQFGFEEWTEVIVSDQMKYEKLNDPFWDNANPGVKYLHPNNTPFPTRKTTDSHSGTYAVHLETMKGKNSVIAMLHTPIFPGSVFRGKFETNIGNPKKSAKFGQAHPKYLGKPKRLKGWYKYKPGEVFQNEKPEPIPGRIDECDIYAVLFKVPKGEGLNEYLTALDVKTSDKIVAKAFLEDWLQDNGGTSARDEYTFFDIPFVYNENPDYNKNDYKLAIVMSSSKEGDFFRGAIGSLLIVDEVEVVCDIDWK